MTAAQSVKSRITWISSKFDLVISSTTCWLRHKVTVKSVRYAIMALECA